MGFFLQRSHKYISFITFFFYNFSTIIRLIYFIFFLISSILCLCVNEVITKTIIGAPLTIVNGSIPYTQRHFHILWIGTSPLRPIGLAAIDSIARHMRDSKVTIHITVEEGIPVTVLKKRKIILNLQANIFTSHGFDLQYMFHDNIDKDKLNSPLMGTALKQRHIAGIWNTTNHEYLGAHATDIMRSILGYKFGGIYMDDDNILLKSLEPLFKFYGSTILTTDHHAIRLTRCNTIRIFSGFFSVHKHHLFMKHYGEYCNRQIEKYGADCFFPLLNNSNPCKWDAIGPVAMSYVHREWWCTSGIPPLIINTIRKEVLESYATHYNTTMNINPAIDETLGYVVIARSYLSPAFWWEKDFLTSNRNMPNKLKIVGKAFQFHVFGPPKHRFLSMLREPKEFPILHYIHQLSCFLLCDLETWTNLEHQFSF